MSIEAMKQAREVIQDYVDEYGPHDKESGAQYVLNHLDQAIEQAEKQEPVAWMWRCKPYCDWPNWSVSLKRPADSGRDGHQRTEGYEDIPLYTTPQPQPLVLEPDYYVYNIDGVYRLADPQPTIRWGKK